MPITAGNGLQYVHRLLSDLWTNSISWQDSDSICSQGFSLLVYLSLTIPCNLLMCNNSTVLFQSFSDGPASDGGAPGKNRARGRSVQGTKPGGCLFALVNDLCCHINRDHL